MVRWMRRETLKRQGPAPDDSNSSTPDRMSGPTGHCPREMLCTLSRNLCIFLEGRSGRNHRRRHRGPFHVSWAAWGQASDCGVAWHDLGRPTGTNPHTSCRLPTDYDRNGPEMSLDEDGQDLVMSQVVVHTSLNKRQGLDGFHDVCATDGSTRCPKSKPFAVLPDGSSHETSPHVAHYSRPIVHDQTSLPKANVVCLPQQPQGETAWGG